MTHEELTAVRQRNETDGIFGPRSIHATEVFKDAQTDRRNLLAHVTGLEAELQRVQGFFLSYPRDRSGWICSVCHQWNHTDDTFCRRDCSVADASAEQP